VNCWHTAKKENITLTEALKYKLMDNTSDNSGKKLIANELMVSHYYTANVYSVWQKKYPRKLFAICWATGWNFNTKFHALITRSHLL